MAVCYHRCTLVNGIYADNKRPWLDNELRIQLWKWWYWVCTIESIYIWLCWWQRVNENWEASQCVKLVMAIQWRGMSWTFLVIEFSRTLNWVHRWGISSTGWLKSFQIDPSRLCLWLVRYYYCYYFIISNYLHLTNSGVDFRLLAKRDQQWGNVLMMMMRWMMMMMPAITGLMCVRNIEPTWS